MYIFALFAIEFFLIYQRIERIRSRKIISIISKDEHFTRTYTFIFISAFNGNFLFKLI